MFLKIILFNEMSISLLYTMFYKRHRIQNVLCPLPTTFDYKNDMNKKFKLFKQ